MLGLEEELGKLTARQMRFLGTVEQAIPLDIIDKYAWIGIERILSERPLYYKRVFCLIDRIQKGIL